VPTDNEFTRILQWPGYRVYAHSIDEKNKTLELWVRRKRGNRKLECSGCGRKFQEAYGARERAVRDLPWSAFTTTVHIEGYREKCPDCGLKIEKVLLLPSQAPFSQRFEDAGGAGLRECGGATGGAAIWVGGERGVGRSTCATWNAGTPPGANRRSSKWEWMRSTWASNRSS